MRVISGKYKGKKLKGFDIDGTRPTMDRVKESLFASIQGNVPNSNCLDLFAGSGALGIEALSMGALTCDFVDNSNVAIKVLMDNTFGVDGSNIIYTDYKKFLKNTSKKYDIIFLDPPYRKNLLNKAIKYIKENDILTSGGLLVCEYEEEKPICDYELIKSKKYGNKMVNIYKK